ncbi:MAG TPA: hypothetical protein VHM24_06660, partial [Gemmatimonadaceae bacterium]|nr:hypothetical protein [Gemmatimonadaceae bacterium]
MPIRQTNDTLLMRKLSLVFTLAVAMPLAAQSPPPPPPPNPPSGNAPPATNTAVPAKWNVMDKRAASKDVDYEVSQG